MKTLQNTNFGDFIDRSIRTAKIKKQDIVSKLQVDPSTLSRILSSEATTKSNVIALVWAINSIANSEIVDLSEALQASGYLSDLTEIKMQVADGMKLVFEKESFSEKQIADVVLGAKIALEISLSKEE